MIRRLLLPLRAGAGVAILAGAVFAAETVERPRMRQMQTAPTPNGMLPPSPRELVDAREVVERRFREPLARTGTAAGANAATAVLLEAAVGEEDRAVKWHLLAEARRLAAAAGNAAAVDRAIILADAAFDFDAIAEEHRLLRGIPLQALDRARAAALAEVAEGLAERAEADGRADVAADAWTLAIRGWQRAGVDDAARRAAGRLGQVQAPATTPAEIQRPG